jgi:hypothetical protein
MVQSLDGREICNLITKEIPSMHRDYLEYYDLILKFKEREWDYTRHDVITRFTQKLNKNLEKETEFQLEIFRYHRNRDWKLFENFYLAYLKKEYKRMNTKDLAEKAVPFMRHVRTKGAIYQRLQELVNGYNDAFVVYYYMMNEPCFLSK